MNANVLKVRSWADATPLYSPLGLWLVPRASLRISLSLPTEEVGDGEKNANRAVSGWEAGERLRELAKPLLFAALKFVSSSSEEMRFDAEAGDRRDVRPLLEKLDKAKIRLAAFRKRVAVAASRLDDADGFPTRHAWDSFFRDAADMDEMKAGERPDTLHLRGLPVDWFRERSDAEKKETDAEPKTPSESSLKKAFERFGRVRRVDAPVCDPYRSRMKEHMRGFTATTTGADDPRFEAYVQFAEYSAFVRAMDALRGARLAKRDEAGGGEAVDVRVDFDRSKHLSDAAVKRRSIVRERLVAADRSRRDAREAERREKDRSEKEKLTHMQEREQRRKAKQLAKLKEKEASEINNKIAQEKKKLLKTQRKLQSIRLIEELFKRIQLKFSNNLHKKEAVSQNSANFGIANREKNKKMLKKIEKALLSEKREKHVRDRLVSKYMTAQEQELEEQRLKLQKALDGKIVLRSVLDTGKHKNRASSISSLSSESDIPEFVQKDIKLEKNISPDRIHKNESGGMLPNYSGPPVQHYNFASYGSYMPNEFGYPVGNFHSRAGYFPQEHNFRGRGYAQRRSRGSAYGGRNFRHAPRMPYFNGPDANQEYYKYFKQLTQASSGNYSRNRSYSRSTSRSRRRSYSRSRTKSRSSRSHSKSRSRSHSDSRSRSRTRSRNRSKSRRRSSSRYRSRYSKSRSYDSRSRSRNRRKRTRSHSDRSKSSHRTKSNDRSSNRKEISKSRSRSRSKSQTKNDNKIKNKVSEAIKNCTDFIPRVVKENQKKNEIVSSSETIQSLQKETTEPTLK